MNTMEPWQRTKQAGSGDYIMNAFPFLKAKLLSVVPRFDVPELEMGKHIKPEVGGGKVCSGALRCDCL